MNIFIYSDESGVFDKEHHDLYVFGGLIFLDRSSRDSENRRYLHAERAIRKANGYRGEIKASTVSGQDKWKLFRSLNACYKFAVVIREDLILDSIFKSKKDKQRYLDYAYKIAIKRALKDLINRKMIDPDEVEGIYFFVDEHTTATNGRYELREGLEQELKLGTYNWNYNRFFEPLFPLVQTIDMKFCNSEKYPLIRAADIVANRVWNTAKRRDYGKIRNFKNLHLEVLP